MTRSRERFKDSRRNSTLSAPKTPTVYLEHAIQCASVQWFCLQYPRRLIYAVPNAARRSAPQAARLKAEGMLAGVPDLVIPEPNGRYHGLYVEMKTPTGTLTVEQKRIGDELRRRGYRVEIARSVTQFMEIVEGYWTEGRYAAPELEGSSQADHR